MLPKIERQEDEVMRKGDVVAGARAKADHLRNLGKKDYEKGNYFKAAQLYKEVRHHPAIFPVESSFVFRRLLADCISKIDKNV